VIFFSPVPCTSRRKLGAFPFFRGKLGPSGPFAGKFFFPIHRGVLRPSVKAHWRGPGPPFPGGKIVRAHQQKTFSTQDECLRSIHDGRTVVPQAPTGIPSPPHALHSAERLSANRFPRRSSTESPPKTTTPSIPCCMAFRHPAPPPQKSKSGKCHPESVPALISAKQLLKNFFLSLSLPPLEPRHALLPPQPRPGAFLPRSALFLSVVLFPLPLNQNSNPPKSFRFLNFHRPRQKCPRAANFHSEPVLDDGS